MKVKLRVKVWHDGDKIKLLLLNTFRNIPKGSVLGPMLYILLTADITASKKVITSTFPDDTAIIS